MFPHARPISFLDSKAKEWAFHPLAKSSARSWGHTESPTSKAGAGGARVPVAPSNATGDGPPPARNGQARDFDPRNDTPGPLTLAGLVIARTSPAENVRQPAILFIGDSDFASNAYLDFSGNTDFMLHVMAWMAEEKDLLTIAPKDVALGTFLLTVAQSNALFAVQVLGLPSFFLAAGFVVWRRRRRL
jgi:ABC-type uncharacterized transport system involved in gliding motility auxiliary subunit